MSTTRWQIVEVPTGFTNDALMGGSVYVDILDNGRVAIAANHAVIPGSGKHGSPANWLDGHKIRVRRHAYQSGVNVHTGNATHKTLLGFTSGGLFHNETGFILITQRHVQENEVTNSGQQFRQKTHLDACPWFKTASF